MKFILQLNFKPLDLIETEHFNVSSGYCFQDPNNLIQKRLGALSKYIFTIHMYMYAYANRPILAR